MNWSLKSEMCCSAATVMCSVGDCGYGIFDDRDHQVDAAQPSSQTNALSRTLRCIGVGHGTSVHRCYNSDFRLALPSRADGDVGHCSETQRRPTYLLHVPAAAAGSWSRQPSYHDITTTILWSHCFAASVQRRRCNAANCCRPAARRNFRSVDCSSVGAPVGRRVP